MQEELVIRRASSGLDRYVERLCGYEYQTAEPALQREPLSTSVVLILGLGPELGLLDRADPGRPPRWLGSFVAGLDDGCTVVAHNGTMHGVQVDLTPLAARMIFRVPMSELAREVTTVEDLLGREGLLLEERLYEAADWQTRFALIEKTLAAKLMAAEPPPPDLEWAWRRLVASRGQLRVTDLAHDLGCTRKHLAARFREHVGLPPKLIARMLRFSHASELIGKTDEGSLARLAAHCGYYDHAHLDRDFRYFANTTPTGFRAEPVTFLQDTPVTVS